MIHRKPIHGLQKIGCAVIWNFFRLIWGRCNLKRSRRTVIVLPVYKISSLKIIPPKTPNSRQFSYPLPNIVSFLFEKNRLEFRFRSRDFSFNLFPVWQPYCWRFWSAIVPTTYSYFYLPLTLSKRKRINVKSRPRYISALNKVVLDISRPKNYRHYFDAWNWQIIFRFASIHGRACFNRWKEHPYIVLFSTLQKVHKSK